MKEMIVDDEKNTRDRLRQFMPWKEIGVDDVNAATNSCFQIAGIALFVIGQYFRRGECRGFSAESHRFIRLAKDPM